MKALNKETAPKTQRPERIIQFGEGNFLRAFVDWIIYNMNQKADFNSSVVVVQPIDKGMVDMLNAQDDLYHVNLQGLDKGEAVNSLTIIEYINDCQAVNSLSFIQSLNVYMIKIILCIQHIDHTFIIRVIHYSIAV